MYNWLSIRLKSRLGIAFSKSNLDYLQVEKVKGFSGLTNVAREEAFGKTTLSDSGKKLFFRLHPHSDTFVLEQVFVNRDYQPVVEAYRNNFAVSDNVRIVDAGANVGYTTAFFLQSMPGSKVVCIEPDVGNIRVLKKNLEYEIERGTVVVLKSALMNKTGLNMATENSFRDRKDWSISVREAKTESELKSISVPDVMSQLGWDTIDILKIDIEGAEQFLFQESENIAWLDTVRILALEIHDEFQIRETICQQLRSHHFDFYDQGETTIGVNRLLKEHEQVVQI